MGTDLISVVVPIYKVEEYLEECVNSILNQTYSNLEVLLVDDGSPDNCPQLCDDFAKKDIRIRVFHKKNGGLSSARNYGIEHAKGKYICFVDSDDFVSNDYIETLYNGLIQNNVDISMCGFTNYYDTQKTFCNLITVKNKCYGKIDAHILLNVLGYYDVASWNKLYKKELFNDIKFPIGKTCEDWRIMYKIFDKANSVYYDSSVKYYYRRRENSITTSKIVRLDALEASQDCIKFYEEKKYNKVLPYAYQSLIIACIGIVNNMIICDDFSKFDDICKIKKTYKHRITYKKLKFSKKVQLFIFIYFTRLYITIFKKRKRG